MKFAVVACQFLCLAALKLNEVGSPGATLVNGTNGSWELSQLIQRVQEADRDGAKKVLADIVRRGGEKHLEEILGRFGAMGYDYTVLLQWLSGTLKLGDPEAIQSKVFKASKASKVTDDYGFNLLLKGLDSSNETLVKDALAQMQSAKDFSSKLLELQRMGYDMAAIKKWLPAGHPNHPSHPETTHLAAVKAGISTAAPESDVDAQQFIDLMKTANEGGMKSKITEAFLNGGMPRIQAALKIVQAWGYDAKDVERLAAGKEMRHTGLKIEEREQQTQTNNQEPTPSTPSPPSTPSTQKSQKATEKTEKQILKNEEKTEKTEKTEKKQKFDALEASEEALSLVKSIAEGDRDGARKEVGYIYAKGGQEELVEVLQRAQFPGHDAAKIQAWIAGETPKQSAPSAPAAPTAPVGLAHESHESHESHEIRKSIAELDTEYLVMRLRDADRKGAADYVIQIFQAGGQQRIQKALAGLKLWGYDPKRFQRWVSHGVPGLLMDTIGFQPKVQQLFADSPGFSDYPDVHHPISAQSAHSIPAVADVADVALATKSAKSKVKLLGVQDFRIAVTDLATAQTAQLNPNGPQ